MSDKVIGQGDFPYVSNSGHLHQNDYADHRRCVNRQTEQTDILTKISRNNSKRHGALIEHTYLFAYLRLVINRNPLICYRCKLNWSAVLSRKTVIKPSSHNSLRKANYELIAVVFIRVFPADNENILNSATLTPFFFFLFFCVFSFPRFRV